MNTTDTIESILKNDVKAITIGVSPNNLVFVQADQFIQTGDHGNSMRVGHQVEDASLSLCLDKLKDEVEKVADMKTRVMHINRRAN